MNRITFATGAAIALTVLVGGAALAQTTDRTARSLRADADGDGRVSRAEFVAARINRLTAIDADRDGSVSAEERRSGIDTRRNQRVSARFETLDKDGDGSLSREEFMTHHEGRGRGPGAGRAGRDVGYGMGPRESGRAGGLSDRSALRGPISIAEVSDRLTTQFDRMDANRDGYLTTDEVRASRATMRNRRDGQGAAGQSSPPATPSE